MQPSPNTEGATPSTTPGDTVRDPVCGMTVIASKAAASAVHGEESYYFCSTHCKITFAARPESYADR